ncbi:MAG: hypothetical protein CSA23_00995 [Deltaproteobacteria bacterium]|nr:MAG: hypothetical protein CSA23_00995 [Deltaproteobacteria bacterium]
MKPQHFIKISCKLKYAHLFHFIGSFFVGGDNTTRFFGASGLPTVIPQKKAPLPEAHLIRKIFFSICQQL